MKQITVLILIAALALGGCATFSEFQQDTQQKEQIAAQLYFWLGVLETYAQDKADPQTLAILAKVRAIVKGYEEGLVGINEANAEVEVLFRKALE